MDRRIIKTKKALIKAFIDLRKENGDKVPLVKDLCELADVNKTTFYRHYKNIGGLIVDACKVIVETIIGDGKYVAYLTSDPEKFLKINIERFETYSEDVKAVASVSQEVFFHVLQERTSREFRKITHREIDDDVLQFVAGGVARVVIELKRSDEKTLHKIAHLIHLAINSVY